MHRPPEPHSPFAASSRPARVVVAGGGFGGYHAARTLERLLGPDQAEIVLVDSRNYLLYTPFLSAVAGGLRDPRHVTFPLRELLPDTDVRVVEIESARPQAKCLRVRNLDGKREDLSYDHLIVSLGSVTRLAPVPGLAECALGFKTLQEATALRDRLIRVLDTAETLEDPAEREPYLTFVFVGAGYAGLGGLAKLRDFAGDVLTKYPRCRDQGMRWMLIDANERVMSTIPTSLSHFAERQLHRRDVEIVSGTTLSEVTPAMVRLSDASVIPTRTVVWTAGVEPSGVVAQLGLPLDGQGRIEVDEHMRVRGYEDVWAVGDAAAVPDPAQPGRACPPTRQHAIRQGDAVAVNVAAALGVGPPAPFTYRTRGVFVGLGKGQGVAQIMGARLRGWPAWLLTGAYNFKQVPGRARKLLLLNDWLMDLLLPSVATESGQAAYPVGALRDRGADLPPIEALTPSVAREGLSPVPSSIAETPAH